MKCRHCGGNWEFDGNITKNTVDLLGRSADRISAAAIRSLHESLSIGMMEAKKLAHHRTKIGHTCFNCSSSLSAGTSNVSNCISCGALNIEVCHASRSNE